MPVGRIDWDDLPDTTRRAVERHIGTVHSARTVSAGQNSAIAVMLDSETGPVFVKGLHRDYLLRWTQDMEAIINPHVAHLAPRLLWRIQDEWDLLGFEVVNGRHADYQPGSPDLALVARTAAELGKIQCPDLPVKRAEHRWREYVSNPGELELLTGDRLLHTDFNPQNVLISCGRALLVDWAWPTRGPGWIDPACLILRLIANGHTVSTAEAVVSAMPTWQNAPAGGLAVFARVCVRMWEGIANNNPTGWTVRMAQASRAWASART